MIPNIAPLRAMNAQRRELSFFFLTRGLRSRVFYHLTETFSFGDRIQVKTVSRVMSFLTLRDAMKSAFSPFFCFLLCMNG